MKLGIIGSRKWPHARRHVISEYIESLPADTVIVTGGWRARLGGYDAVEATAGVDRLAWKAADGQGFVTVLVAGSSKRGRLAGLQRNPVVVDLSEAIVAFWDGESRGTAGTMLLALAKPLQVLVIGPEGTMGEEWIVRARQVMA